MFVLRLNNSLSVGTPANGHQSRIEGQVGRGSPPVTHQSPPLVSSQTGMFHLSHLDSLSDKLIRCLLEIVDNPGLKTDVDGQHTSTGRESTSSPSSPSLVASASNAQSLELSFTHDGSGETLVLALESGTELHSDDAMDLDSPISNFE